MPSRSAKTSSRVRSSGIRSIRSRPCPTHSRSWPNSASESAAAGCPTIASGIRKSGLSSPTDAIAMFPSGGRAVRATVARHPGADRAVRPALAVGGLLQIGHLVGEAPPALLAPRFAEAIPPVGLFEVPIRDEDRQLLPEHRLVLRHERDQRLDIRLLRETLAAHPVHGL